jgi:hypothetical protein
MKTFLLRSVLFVSILVTSGCSGFSAVPPTATPSLTPLSPEQIYAQSMDGVVPLFETWVNNFNNTNELLGNAAIINDIYVCSIMLLSSNSEIQDCMSIGESSTFVQPAQQLIANGALLRSKLISITPPSSILKTDHDQIIACIDVDNQLVQSTLDLIAKGDVQGFNETGYSITPDVVSANCSNVGIAIQQVIDFVDQNK